MAGVMTKYDPAQGMRMMRDVTQGGRIKQLDQYLVQHRIGGRHHHGAGANLAVNVIGQLTHGVFEVFSRGQPTAITLTPLTLTVFVVNWLMLPCLRTNALYAVCSLARLDSQSPLLSWS